jgi:hypothetical protein
MKLNELAPYKEVRLLALVDNKAIRLDRGGKRRTKKIYSVRQGRLIKGFWNGFKDGAAIVKVVAGMKFCKWGKRRHSYRCAFDKNSYLWEYMVPLEV